MLLAVHNLAITLAVVAVSMLLTALAGFGFGEASAAQQFAAIAVLTGFVAGGLFFATRVQFEKGLRPGKFLFVVLAWIVPPLFAAIPLIDASGGYLPALFEAISGLTTTGATIFERVAPLDRTLILWRAELHWLGGFLTLALIVTVLAPGGIGGIPSRQSVFTRRPVSGEGGRPWHLLRDALVGYLLVTFVIAVSLVFAGLPGFDAICLAMSAIATGAFMPIDGGVVTYASPSAEIILALAMLVGATSILWHRMIAGLRWEALRDHRESYWLVATALVVGLAYAVSMMTNLGHSFGLALHRGLATGASLVSTSGIEIEAGGFRMLPVPIVLLVALVGGGSFSTAGGLRLFRVGGMLVESLKETRRLIYPHGMTPRPFGAREFDIGTMKAIWSLFSATLALLAAVAVAISLIGIDFGGALAATVSAFSNIGPVFSSSWAEASAWPSYAEMPAGAQMLLAAVMIVGRVEIIALVVAISLFVWRS